MTARDYIHELLEFDKAHPEKNILDLEIYVHDGETGILCTAASYFLEDDDGRACMHLDSGPGSTVADGRTLAEVKEAENGAM